MSFSRSNSSKVLLHPAESFNKIKIHEKKPRRLLGLLSYESTVRESDRGGRNMKEVSECADFVDTDFAK